MSKWLEFPQYPGTYISEDLKQLKVGDKTRDLQIGQNVTFRPANKKHYITADPETLMNRLNKAVAANLKKDEKARKARERARRAKEREAKKLAREKRKEERAARRFKKSKKRHQLVPDEVALAFQERLKLHKSPKSPKTLKGFLVEYKKNHRATAITVNEDTGVILIRIFGPQNWREGRFFYNPNTEQYVAYDSEQHKSGYGADSIVWPVMDENPMFASKHNVIHPTIQKAAKRLGGRRYA